MSTELERKFERFRSFQRAVMSGSGFTRRGDAGVSKFHEHLKSGEFVKSGMANVADALQENIMRLRSHAELPWHTLDYGRSLQRVRDHLLAERGLTDVPMPGLDDGSLDVRGEVEKRVLEWMFNGGAEYSNIAVGPTTSNTVGGYFIFDRPAKNSQFTSFCGSLIIEAWAIFESISEDAWEAALNSHPTVLGNLDGKSRVTYEHLQMHGFNLSSKMGTISKQNDIIGFRSIYDIRESYRRAFKEQRVTIDDTLFDKGLQFSAAVRNLVIHKRGIVDAEFKQQTSGIPNIPPCEVGKTLPITGELCEILVDNCCCCAKSLVSAVHAWIIGHPESTHVKSP